MAVDTVGTPVVWGAFALIVAGMLALDLGVFHRHAHVVSVREATAWTLVWILVSLTFNAFVWAHDGADKGQEFLAGYAIEKALSVDNLFVIYAVFAAFRVEAKQQHRVLFWGILGAVVMRALMVFAGAALLERFHFLLFVFGGALILAGARMLVRREDAPHPEESRVLRWARHVLPITDEPANGRFFRTIDGKRHATSIFLALIAVEASDAVFAVDSIFAIFAITLDPFIVLTSNVFALLGLRSLFFVLAGAAERFRYVQPGLALVLVFVGMKMGVSDWYKLPVLVSLLVVAILIGGSVVASLVHARGRKQREATADALTARGG